MKKNIFSSLSIFISLFAFLLPASSCDYRSAPDFAEAEMLLATELMESCLTARTEPVPLAPLVRHVGTGLPETPLQISTSFAIARPVPGQNLETTRSSYYITGTSDPALPLFLGEQEVARPGSEGTFGVFVELAPGENTFAFSQGGVAKTITITRTPEQGIAPIREIDPESMVPVHLACAIADEPLTVGCIAPSGAAVTAAYGDASAELKQADKTLAAGLPAVFIGSLRISGEGVPADEISLGDRVRYTLTYQGSHKEAVSKGRVYIAGARTKPVAEVASYAGFIRPDPANPGWIREIVKAGARDYIVGQTNAYFELASGGFLSKEQAVIPVGRIDAVNHLNSVSFSAGEKLEQFVFHGSGRPFYDAWIADDMLYLRLCNTTGVPLTDTAGSRLVTDVSVTADEDAVTYRFPLKGLVWGFDISFQDSNTVLTLRYKPASRAESKPLEGVAILVDPGHGGSDPGALGVAGPAGPSEADLNLVNALAIRDRLQGLGATVYMTRDTDSTLSLDDRLALIESRSADFFLAIHHNSLPENADAGKVDGLEIFYHTPQSQLFANTAMNHLSAVTGRKNRLVEQSFYRVTLLYHCPSILVELGYLSNPLEYERAMEADKIGLVAEGIASGIVEMVCS